MAEVRDKWHDFPETYRVQLNAIYSSLFLGGLKTVE